MNEKQQFRASMRWLHKWIGLILGALLFTVFWMGTLSVFDKEIDQWMQPEIRFNLSSKQIDVDSIVEKIKAMKPDDKLSSLLIYLPSKRKPYIEVNGRFKTSKIINERFHPETGESLGKSNSRAGSGFIYPMHYRLQGIQGLGYWFIAFATLFMMVLLVTGVVIHRKIFADFFTFRKHKKLPRATLDLHNITGTIFLPFHFLICLSGLTIFAGWYISLTSSITQSINNKDRTVELFYAADDYGYYKRPASEIPAEMLKLAPLIAQAEKIWANRYGENASVDRIDVNHYGDKNAYIEIRRHFPSNRTEAHSDSINFDGINGEILKDFVASPIRKIRTWLEGFHQIQFDHWPIRWLYFIAGLSGCILIATGFVYWISNRTDEKGHRELLNVRLVEALSIGSITGCIAATASLFVVNRLIAMSDANFDRSELEIKVFFCVWLFTFVHAVIRKSSAWLDQCWLIAALCLSAVLLNWFTTAFPFTLTSKVFWPVTGVDLVLILSTFIAIKCALRLKQPKQVESKEGVNSEINAALINFLDNTEKKDK
jgi:uncharacterized iron-regulated membrane protein